MRVLHVIRQVTRGGGTLGVLAQCRAVPACHQVLSLRPPSDPAAVAPLEQAGVAVRWGEGWREAVEGADVVQLEWWNNPEINDFVANAGLPPCRLLLHSRAHFDAPWMCPSVALLARVDACTVTTPGAALNPAFEANRRRAGLPPARCVFSAAGDPGARRAPGREGPVVFGYHGTVEPIKLHPRFLEIARRVLDAVPDAEFRFAGEGTLDEYRDHARRLGIGERVSFPGFVDDVGGFLAGVDVFFYPISPWTYATSEKALQEAMLAGLPCVVFPHGGIRDLASPLSAVVARDEEAFARGCVRLARSARLRARLGERSARRIRAFACRRSFRDDLRAAWAGVMAAPRRPRPALGVPREALFEWATDPAGLRPAPRSEADRAACRQVAAFVEEGYREWLGS
ncbi:MAG TPA: glycosyltransferase family 4 protein [Longimicrobium sp.]|nr:glycosyltransferase family 4 protein [Longimicrobium sp.]